MLDNNKCIEKERTSRPKKKTQEKRKVCLFDSLIKDFTELVKVYVPSESGFIKLRNRLPLRRVHAPHLVVYGCPIEEVFPTYK